MKTYRLVRDGVEDGLARGLGEIVAAFPDRFDEASAIPVAFSRDEARAEGGAEVTVRGDAVTVVYGRRADAFRALGRLLGQEAPTAFGETPAFSTRGAMIDVSRNGVLTLEGAKAFLRHMALMGLNMAMLYAEDTYEVSGEPFFGYLRGRYTASELKALDDYADDLGIEMIPCVQALGHLAQILQWPAYADLTDVDGVLLAEEPRTYALLERMLAAASAPFRTRRIHIGMDEAHGVGTGAYRRLHGETRPFDVLNRHLEAVRGLCEKQGLRPMIWSDMYFRLGSKTNNYYDLEAEIPGDVIDAIPRDVRLVYWDYYHTDADFYARFIDLHRTLGSEPIMAGGIWTWNRFWTAYPFSFHTTRACMTACREKKLDEVFMTLWGDDGMECDVFSALPGLQFFAELCYADTVDEKRMRAHFRGACGADFDAMTRGGAVDVVPGLDDPERNVTNVGKQLLWQDPVLPIVDGVLDGDRLADHYRSLARELFAHAEAGGLARRLAFPACLAHALGLKATLRTRLHAAYVEGDRATLGDLARETVPALRASVDALWRQHRAQWHATYKPFGWEVIDRRYGGLRNRLETLAWRLGAYLDGTVEALPELAEPLGDAFPEERRGKPGVCGYAGLTSPSVIRV